MIKKRDSIDFDGGAEKLKSVLRDQKGLGVDRMPGLAHTLNQFVVEAQQNLLPLLGRASGAGAIEPAQGTTLFQAVNDCGGLAGAIYCSVEPEGLLLIALDERIDRLIVASVFGEITAPSIEDNPEVQEPRSPTAIESALIEEFARLLGRALEAAFASIVPLSIIFDRLVTLSDASALWRRDGPAAAARFSLPLSGGSCDGLILLPQSLLLPFRKELEREAAEPTSPDRRWSRSMETGVKQTRLPVTAILEEFPMSLGEVANIRTGAVLPLQRGDFDSIRLECSGRGMFLCKLGQGDGRYRLEIDVPIAQVHEPAAA
jgi:flagellar motor switch protein FliM